MINKEDEQHKHSYKPNYEIKHQIEIPLKSESNHKLGVTQGREFEGNIVLNNLVACHLFLAQYEVIAVLHGSLDQTLVVLCDLIETDLKEYILGHVSERKLVIDRLEGQDFNV